MNPIIQDELNRLLADLASGELTVRQAQRLDEILAEDQAARAYYLDQMTLEAGLHGRHTYDLADRSVSVADLSGKHHSPLAFSSAWPALAALLLVAVALSSWMTASFLMPPASSTELAQHGENAAIGAISATRNCRWATAGGGFGDLIFRGQRLSLQQGVAEIAFNSGARLLLEGPAVLQIRADGGADLVSGRLAIDSPADIEALAIRCGRLRVADAGVAYGLIAESSGAGEVHVFRGVVQAAVLGDLGQQVRSCRLSKGRGARLEVGEDDWRLIAARDGLFVRSLSPTNGARHGLYACENFDYGVGPLGEQNGGFGWASAWEDLETQLSASGDSTSLVGERSLDWAGVPAVGGRAMQVGNKNRVRRSLSLSINGALDTDGFVEDYDGQRLIGQTGKTIYVAFLQKASIAGDVFYGVELNRGDGNFNRVLCIGHGVELSGFAATSNYNHLIDEQAVSLGEENADVNFYVVRIDYGPQDADRATVYRNPRSLVDEAACHPTAVMQGNFAFDRISLGNYLGTKTHEVDDLRVGADFRVVTGQRNFIHGQLAGVVVPEQQHTLLTWRGSLGQWGVTPAGWLAAAEW